MTSEQSEPKSTQPSKPFFQKLKKEIFSLFIIGLIIFGLRSVFYEPFRIPSGSMIPTLLIGDFILVDKFEYGFKLPFSDYLKNNPIYLFGKKEPKRGDVIVFRYPEDSSLNFIKRVVGIPGDQIQVIDNIVYLNGTSVKQQDILTSSEGKTIMEDMDEEFKRYTGLRPYKTQTGNYTHYIMNDLGPPSQDYDQGMVVPKGHFFVMGYNRNHSDDSRRWGLVPFENIRGKAVLIWISLIFPFGDHDFKFRYWRIGNLIHENK